MKMPELDNFRPYCVLATMDGESDPQWFVRSADDWYQTWRRPWLGMYWPRELTPVTRDFCRFTGDPIAIAECWAAREIASKEQAT